jgi:hypothetical protein
MRILRLFLYSKVTPEFCSTPVRISHSCTSIITRENESYSARPAPNLFLTNPTLYLFLFLRKGLVHAAFGCGDAGVFLHCPISSFPILPVSGTLWPNPRPICAPQTKRSPLPIVGSCAWAKSRVHAGPCGEVRKAVVSCDHLPPSQALRDPRFGTGFGIEDFMPHWTKDAGSWRTATLVGGVRGTIEFGRDSAIQLKALCT